MAWILALLALACLIGMWFTSSAGVFGLLLVLGLGSAIAAALGFAHARIAGNARPEVIVDPKVQALRAERARRQAQGRSAD